MSVQENRDIVMRFVGTLGGARDMSVIADDCIWWVPGRGELDRKAFEALAGGFRGVLAGPFRMEVLNVTAEEDRVAVETRGEAPLTNGKTYRNSYHFLFRLRDGKICEIREHNNSLIPHLLFGDRLPPLPELAELAELGLDG